MAITLQWTLSYANRRMNRNSPRTWSDERREDASEAAASREPGVEAGERVFRKASIWRDDLMPDPDWSDIPGENAE
jgi:hypothetical protein